MTQAISRSRPTDITFILCILLTFSYHTVKSFQQPCSFAITPRCIYEQTHYKRTTVYLSKEQKTPEERMEESRIKILESRRKSIRSMLKSAEQVKNFRLEQGWVETTSEEKSASDAKFAIGLTAFIVTVGAILIRFGGRAALISTLGLSTENNPELTSQLTSFLDYTTSLDPTTMSLLFLLGWIVVKMACLDAGGVVLALSSGILFGGVLQGALASAVCATIGSVLAFLVAKVDSPLREKALELVEKYPSLKGVEKVVAKDGVKAVLTLRLAPVLPIPIGMYNYVYGAMTSVSLLDFALGIFIGSLKPYFLDSYLGYFGKSVLEGNAGDGNDYILLGILGLSILIGVFATQLANETWESVQQEMEAAAALNATNVEEEEEDNGILSKFFVPFNAASDRIQTMVETEYNAKVWNYTLDEIPKEMNPAFFPNSPERIGKDDPFDFGSAFFDGFVLTPVLLQAFMKYSDPSMAEKEESRAVSLVENGSASIPLDVNSKSLQNATTMTTSVDTNDLFQSLSTLRLQTEERLRVLDDKLEKL